MPFEINGQFVDKHLLHYVPHGINSNVFKPIPKDDSFLKKRKKDLFHDKDYKFVLLYNSRNVQRKRTSNIVLAYRTFCDNLPKEEAKKCLLVLHTEIRCDAGTDLIAVKEALCPDYDIAFSTNKLTPDDMNILYNIADVTINASCIPPGYKVVTKNGYKNIENIQINDEVLTHKGRFKKVLKTFEYDNKNSLMVKITPFNLKNPIELTGDHKVLCIKRKEMENRLMNENESIEKYIKWIPSKDLEPSDLVMYPKNKDNFYEDVIFDLSKYISNKRLLMDDKFIYYKHSKNKINRYVKLNKDLSYLLGRWCGDGSRNTISFDAKYGKNEPEKLGKIFSENFDGSYVVKHHNDKTKKCLEVYFKHKYISLIVNFIKSLCGDNSFNKKIPHEILYNKNDDIIQSFINGLIDSDGCERNSNGSINTKIVTVSENLKNEIILSLIRLNKKVKIDIGDSGYKKGNKHYQIMYSHNNIDNGSHRTWFRDDYYLMSINKVEKYEYTGKVHNIEVEEDNSYTMESFTVHNSNEGFGLSTAESLMSGTPIIVNVTGGLQDQIGQTKDDGSPIEFDANFGSNNVGRYRKHGVWAYPIWPATSYIQGSIPTPYIFDDMARWEDAAEAIMYWYQMDIEKRRACGIKGREWALNEGGINAKNMCTQFIKAMDYTISNFKPVKQFGLFTEADYVGNQTLHGLGFEIPKIDKEKIQKEIELINI